MEHPLATPLCASTQRLCNTKILLSTWLEAYKPYICKLKLLSRVMAIFAASPVAHVKFLFNLWVSLPKVLASYLVSIYTSEKIAATLYLHAEENSHFLHSYIIYLHSLLCRPSFFYSLSPKNYGRNWRKKRIKISEFFVPPVIFLIDLWDKEQCELWSFCTDPYF